MQKDCIRILTYDKFLSNMETVLALLYQLLTKSQPWCWSKADKHGHLHRRNYRDGGFVVNITRNYNAYFCLGATGVLVLNDSTYTK